MMSQNSKTYITKAIILNRKDYGEADRLFVFYSPEYGKIEAVATSAKKASSKMAKFLEPLMEINLLLVKGRNYDRIAEVVLLDNFDELKQTREKWGFGCYCLEVVDKLTKVGLPQGEIFVLLKDILNILKKDSNKNLITFYIWRLLSELGYRPQLNSCVECSDIGSYLNNNFYFDINKGGLVCIKCSKKNITSLLISFKVINFLNKHCFDSLTNFKKLDINKDESNQLKYIVGMSLDYHLDYKLKTVSFFK